MLKQISEGNFEGSIGVKGTQFAWWISRDLSTRVTRLRASGEADVGLERSARSLGSGLE